MMESQVDRELLEKIEFFKSVLENPEVLRSELKREIREIRETFATPRRTEVLTDARPAPW